MKCNHSLVAVTLLLSLMFVVSGNASAQHLISTKAGFVNRADGTVYVLRHDSEDGKAGRASLGTELREGDQLRTDVTSRAEILLNPGTYLRLNENTEVRAITTSLSNTRFELLKGSIIIESSQIDKTAPIEIITPNGPLALAKDSLIRVDAKTGATFVAVRQGEIFLGTRDVALANQGKAKVKRGKVARLTGGTAPADLAKVDKDAVDSFDVWSFSRAQTLVAANLSSVRQNSLLAGGWYYSSAYSCYTFVPYRGSMFSPYGYGFFRNWADCYWYNPFYGTGYYNPYYNSGYGNNGGGGPVISNNIPARVVAGNDRAPMRREMPAGRGIDGDSGFGASMGGRGISSSSSSISAPSAAPSVVSAPAPARSSSGSGSAMPSRGNNN
jgi:hypothetical protein